MKENKICFVCGKPAECVHHLVFGRGYREIADQDGLKVPLCNTCHNMHIMTKCQIHDNPMAESLSKIIGQLMFEMSEVEKGSSRSEARKRFIKRYGRSFIYG